MKRYVWLLMLSSFSVACASESSPGGDEMNGRQGDAAVDEQGLGLNLTTNTSTEAEGSFVANEQKLFFRFLRRGEGALIANVTGENGEVYLNVNSSAAVALPGEAQAALDFQTDEERELVAQLFRALERAGIADRFLPPASAPGVLATALNPSRIPPGCYVFAVDECCFGFWKWTNYHMGCVGDVSPYADNTTGWAPDGFCFGGYCASNLPPY